ncbi:MAG: hypothetical protein GWN18_02465 [Thermoplasmata archaeon]|nr:hypothetical protein [Thermoplasmata archaeon]NIU47970.1 hypothetical protein [Thermoplasmata archaeon]NIW81451.1 hypothetical protein [Thermoplasmata archaeon]NIW87657.1 hypothetical protein [Thermoplasmata archaeon]
MILKGIKDPEQTCYVVVGVDREYRSEEIEIIEHFVREEGGKAIIMDDFGSPNALSEKFGVFFYGRPMWDDINMTGPQGKKNISFPVFNFKLGLQPHSVVMNGPTGLTTYNTNVEYIANGSEKSYVDLDGNGRINIGDKKGNIPVILEIRFNESDGRVVFIADADVATDDMLKHNPNNKAFMIQLVNRIMDRKDGLILFDESRHEHPPSQELIYKNVETVAVMSSWIWPTIMTLVAMLVIFTIIVYNAQDKTSWIHRFDVSAFSRRADPPERIAEQITRARHALMLKVRMMYSYSHEEMAALGPDQLRAMIKDNDLAELALSEKPNLSQQELRVLIQRIKEWGTD